VGTASDGEQAVQRAQALQPDLITMDIRMPRVDGLEATRRIMQLCPTPIIMVSASLDSSDLPHTFSAIQAGALDVIEKPSGTDPRDFEGIRQRLVTAVRLMAGIKVIRRRPAKGTAPTPSTAPLAAAAPRSRFRLVAIGSSTGGPMALHTLLHGLPRDFPVPVVVVQHMSPGFLAGLVSWLQVGCALPLQVAQDGQAAHPGQVYFAPDEQHLVFAGRGVLRLIDAPPVSHVRPSATVLFESIARLYGHEALGVLLTGMGDDGALGLQAIHERGGLTLAQDEATSVVYGMPRVAAELGAVDHSLPLPSIASRLVEWVGH
jgi:two-component system chemotaxis response regulator CheB